MHKHTDVSVPLVQPASGKCSPLWAFSTQKLLIPSEAEPLCQCLRSTALCHVRGQFSLLSIVTTCLCQPEVWEHRTNSVEFPQFKRCCWGGHLYQGFALFHSLLQNHNGGTAARRTESGKLLHRSNFFFFFLCREALQLYRADKT